MMQQRHSGRVGPLLILISATAFGAMAVFGKLAYAAGATSETLVLVRFTIAALLLAVLLAVRPGLRVRPEAQDGRPHWPVVLIALSLGAVGYATQASLFFAALERISAPLVSLVLYTYPAMVTLAAVLLGRDRLTGGRLAALAAASIGTLLVLVGAGGLGFDAVGVALGFGAAVTYTVYILVADTVLHRMAPVVLTALVMTGAAGALWARSLLGGGPELGLTAAGWFWIGCIAVVSTVLAVLTFFAGMRRTGASTASILSTFEPVVAAALAAVVLGEVLTPVQLLGALLVLSAAVLVQWRPRDRAVPAVSDTAAVRQKSRCDA
jgi:drug/metabolite transporter (DMT)-like permease